MWQPKMQHNFLFICRGGKCGARQCGIVGLLQGMVYCMCIGVLYLITAVACMDNGAEYDYAAHVSRVAKYYGKNHYFQCAHR